MGPSPAPACLRALLWREERVGFCQACPAPSPFLAPVSGIAVRLAGLVLPLTGLGTGGQGKWLSKGQGHSDAQPLPLPSGHGAPPPLGTGPLPKWIWTLPPAPFRSCPLLPAWPLPSCPLCWSFSPCYVIFGTLLVNKGIKSQSKQVPDSLASGLGLTVSWSPLFPKAGGMWGRTVL